MGLSFFLIHDTISKSKFKEGEKEENPSGHLRRPLFIILTLAG